MIQIIKKYAVALIALICFSYANTAGAQTSFDQAHEWEFQQALMSSGSYTISENINTVYQLVVAVGKNVTLDLNGKTLTARDTDYALNVSGGASKATLTLSNGTLNIGSGESYNKGLYNEGTLNINATITSSYNVPFITNDSGCTVNITGGTYSKNTTGKPLFDNSGTINISGGNFPGTNANFAGGTVNISGGTFGNVNIAGGTVKITGGSFGNVTFGTGNIVITGGTFGTDVSSKVPEGYQCTNVGGTWKVERAGVAQIGTTLYETLQDAIDDAGDGDEIQLLTDVTESISVGGEQNITIDLNGKKITNSSYTYTIVNSGTLILKNAGTIDGNNGKAISNNGTLTIKAATLASGGGYAYIISPSPSSVLNIEGGVYPEYIEANGSTSISGGTFNSYLKLNGNASISAGIFTAEIEASSLSITGGTFNNSIDVASFIADGYGKLDNGNGTYTIKPCLASIGTKKYVTIAQAIADATDGATINLLANVTESVTVPAGKNITIDLKTFTLTGADGVRTITNNGTLVVNNGTLASVNQSIVENAGTLTLNVTATSAAGTFPLITNNASAAVLNIANGSYTCTAASASQPVLNNGAGTMNISGGTFKTTASAAVANAGTINIKGGTYSSDVSSLLTASYVAENNGDGTWTVKNAVVATIGDVEYTSLADAITAAQNGETIKLVADVDATEQIDIPANKDVTFDLNGHRIDYTAATVLSSGVIMVHNGAALTVTDSATGGTISAGNKAYAGIALTKAGDDASVPAKLTVNGGNIEGLYYGIVGNGGRPNTIITINGGNITGTYPSDNQGIYHPQDGILTINGGTITGYSTAVEMRAGTINVTGGKLEATSDTYECNANTSGTTTKGAALAIAQHTTKKDIAVTITGGEFKGLKAINESNPQENDPAPKVTMMINDGFFDGDITTKDVFKFISGGVYTTKPADSLCVEGFAPKKNSEGNYEIQKSLVARIGGLYFNTLQNAIDNANDEDIIRLVANISENVVIPADKNITIDLEECTINGKQFEKTATILNKGTLTLKNGIIKREADGSEDWYIIENEGTLDLNAKVIGAPSHALIFNAAGEMNIADGTYTQADPAFNVIENQATMNISGGTFNGDILNRAEDVDGSTITITDGLFNGNKLITSVGVGMTSAPILISGGKFTSTADDFFSISGISYTSDVRISGGIFGSEIFAEVCAEGYSPVQQQDGTWTVYIVNPVASIEDTPYFTLQAAIDAVTAGQTVKMLSDVSENIVVADKKFTLDMNGYTLSEDIVNNPLENVISVGSTAELTIKGNGTVQDVAGTHGNILILSEGKLTIEDGTFLKNNKKTPVPSSYIVIQQNKGTLNINGGNITNNVVNGKPSHAVKVIDNVTLNITDGTFRIPDIYGNTSYLFFVDKRSTANISGGDFKIEGARNVIMYLRSSTANITGGTFEYPQLEDFAGIGTGKVYFMGGKYNHDLNELESTDLLIPENYMCVEDAQPEWWTVVKIPSPTTLEYYVGKEKKVIEATETETIEELWEAVLLDTPNATAAVEKMFSIWAKKQTNIIYPGEYNNMVCENLELTDLTEDGFNNATNAGRTDFYTPVKQFEAVNMTYVRKMNEGWNSMVLPFSFIPENMNTASDFYFTKVLVNPELKGDVVEFSEQSLSSYIEAGTPVIVHSMGGTFDFSANNIVISSEVKSANGMIGAYYTTNHAGKYALNNGETLAPLEANLFPFRACINVSSNAKALRFTYNGIAGIHDIIFNESEANEIFNVSGMKVNNANKPGLYIINGKKVMKK